MNTNKQTNELNKQKEILLNNVSMHLNDYYNLDTWVNPKTKTLWLSVWDKNLSNSYDIEMSFNQTLDFYNEVITNNKIEYNGQKTTNTKFAYVIGMDIIFDNVSDLINNNIT